MTRRAATVIGKNLVIEYESHEAAMAAIEGPLCYSSDHRALRKENERLRAAVAEGDRRIEALRERIHPTTGGYCPACGGGCLIVFAAAQPARDAVREVVP